MFCQTTLTTLLPPFNYTDFSTILNYTTCESTEHPWY